ncbi:GGDEF domain-containing protein [Pseudoduganella lutea]|uniref:diguanylate cyclase n=1 Tax=Pseudoduganella lutea TaxID=321985 RepID=A0A4P6L4G9_9BURK|nr:GGDEF domain-containing protein [Pseudoduganella lutea]QBE65722.1 sensor domain-containing diguanylate cyclase [Pseudoduganella lutea]
MSTNRTALVGQSIASMDLKDALMVGVIVYACTIFGIYTAQPDTLSAFWPSNAVLVGLLLRRAHPPTLAHWAAAIIGYVLGDTEMLQSWPKTLMLIWANLMGVSVCYLALSRMSEAHRGLRNASSMVRFVLVVISGAAAAGVAGFFIHPRLYGGTPAHGFAFWFSTELVNYIAMLPVMLTMPTLSRGLARYKRRTDWPSLRAEEIAPLAAFAASLWLGTQLGGPGVIPYPVPAMLWCALTYGRFATACITLFFSMWTLIAISNGTLLIGASFDSQEAVMSLRVGVIFTALAPLTVASVMAARNALLARLMHVASHDSLTHALNRGGFMTGAEAVLATPKVQRQPVAVLMMDIDLFKAVNDNHGHAAGDVVLTSFAGVAQSHLRKGDLLGRLGGEEFAVLLPGCSPDAACAIAQRICDAFAAHPVAVGGDAPLHSTVSIGVACWDKPAIPVEAMLGAADAALYTAKRSGRNRIVRSA